MKAITYIITILFLCSAQGYGQNVCKQSIQTYQKRMVEIGAPENDAVYYMHYSTSFEYWDADMAAENVNTKFYMGANHLHYFSNVVDIYTDDTYMATVLKNEQKIVITLKPQNQADLNLFSTVSEAQAILLDSANVLQCRQENDRGTLVLDTESLNWANFFLEKLTYEYDLQSGDVLKTISEYDEQYELKKMTITNHQLNLKSKYNGFKSVKEMLMKKNGTLIDKYKGYEIITD